MRRHPEWFGRGAIILAGALLCPGCGGSLYDTPGDLSKGPPVTDSMRKKAEEYQARKEAMKTKAGGKASTR
jgi:hypothetical protein